MERERKVNVQTLAGSRICPRAPRGSTCLALQRQYGRLPARIRNFRFAGFGEPSGGEEWGPCLYLGPSGQRCARPALEGGFCAVHSARLRRGDHPESEAGAGGRRRDCGILWPYVDDVVREIIRWMHSHWSVRALLATDGMSLRPSINQTEDQACRTISS